MGKFDYIKECENWSWDIPENYNIGYDCVDKHTLTDKKNKVALFWEHDNGNTEKLTFQEMKNFTNKFLIWLFI